MRSLFIILFLVQNVFASSPMDTPSEFDDLKTRAQLSIDIPDGYEEIDIPFLHKIPHNFAVGTSDSSAQIRFWIRPLDTWMEDYNKKSKREKKKSMHPNALCKSMMMLSVMDVSNNKSRGYQPSQYPELTQKIHNADWEASMMVEVGYSEVNFKYCFIWCLHKDDIGDIYVYMLADKKEDFFKIMGEMTPLVKFK